MFLSLCLYILAIVVTNILFTKFENRDSRPMCELTHNKCLYNNSISDWVDCDQCEVYKCRGVDNAG